MASWTGFSSSFPYSSSEFCKPWAGEAAWPDTAAWTVLNQSVSGRLIAPVPVAAVCHPSWPEYNNASCGFVATQWSNTNFTTNDPVAVDYNDETCLPYSNASCSAEGYPRYVIVAETAQDVQEGVNFARESGVRLVIKGTGHDYPGRSSGPDSLAIYTHHIRGLEVNYSDARATALGAYASIKIHAGHQIADIERYAAQNNITAIGGSDPYVGIGGWVSGGGHGPLTGKYGLGADQVIEMEVVTADGQLRTINAECDADLFWALRGGGAGTYAVLVSVTMKAYEAVNATEVAVYYHTTADSETFWSLSAYFHSQLPALAEQGIYGYYYIIPYNSTNTDNSTSGVVWAAWNGPNLSFDEIQTIIAPMSNHIGNATWDDPVYPFSIEVQSGLIMEYWSKNVPDSGGTSSRLGSRLLSNASLLGDFEKLKNALRTSTPAGETLLGHLVGPAATIRHPVGAIAGGSDALLPAWREAYAHAVLPRSWTPLNQTQKLEKTTDLREVRVPALRELEPDSGMYMSESDPTQPDWQQEKFGKNYLRLLEIKQTWDPKGVFWCTQCVGSELWNVDGAFGIENGVGQNKVRLCRAH